MKPASITRVRFMSQSSLHRLNRTNNFKRFQSTINNSEAHLTPRESKLLNLTIHEISRLLDKKETTSTEITRATIKQAKKIQPKLNAFITIIDENKLLEQSQNSDLRRKEGKVLSELDGIPVCVKDNFCTTGEKTTCASKMLAGSTFRSLRNHPDFVPPYNAVVCERLSSKGAIIVGKTNMDEFAMGSSTTNGRYGPAVNPWSQGTELLTAGGSSGGSAVAVSSRASYAGLGSDTGGSVRQPAAHCGLVGLKPSYGRVPRLGLVAYASSLDVPSIFARSVYDVGLMLEVTAGSHAGDATCLPSPVPEYSREILNFKNTKDNNTLLKGIHIGIPKEYFVKELDASILNLWKEGIAKFESLGAQVSEVSLPQTQFALPVYYVIAPAEAYSNLARYDGVRYGYRATKTNTGEDIRTIEDLYSFSRDQGFGEEVKRRLLTGTFVLSRKSMESYYKKAQQLRRLISDDFDRVFNSGVDVLLTPTTHSAAFPLHSKLSPVEMYINDVMTIPASLSGLPAVSVPIKLNENKLPLGLQLIGKYFDETKLLQVASTLESPIFQTTPPPLW